MNFRHLFKRHAKGGIISAIRGIKEHDWHHIYGAIKAEYDATAMNHKKPTEYMRGLAFALNIMEAIQPYDIAEVQ